MKGVLTYLKEAAGYALALVADTRPGTYVNVLKQHGVYDHSMPSLFLKNWNRQADPRMFQHALDQLGLILRSVMCGNNLGRDIAGAKALGDDDSVVSLE